MESDIQPHGNTDPGAADKPEASADDRLGPLVLARLSVGGVFMGLANLVPGISGGTMLVASGVYERFIRAISDVTRLKFGLTPIVTLGIVVGMAGIAIVGLAGVISAALTNFLWGMYALFIGLTLGGIPVLARMVRPMDRNAWMGFGAGLVVMLAIVGVQEFAGARGIGATGPALLVLAGVAGASAMILPGLSGAYVLLLLGQYQSILDAVSRAKDGVTGGDLGASMQELRVLAPVGVGVVLGIVAVSNLLRWLLRRHNKLTIGVLLGLLAGAPAGLYPFREGVAPKVGDEFKGAQVTEESLDEALASPKDWQKATFTPNAAQAFGALGLIGAGFVITMAVAMLGRERKRPVASPEEAG